MNCGPCAYAGILWGGATYRFYRSQLHQFSHCAVCFYFIYFMNLLRVEAFFERSVPIYDSRVTNYVCTCIKNPDLFTRKLVLVRETWLAILLNVKCKCGGRAIPSTGVLTRSSQTCIKFSVTPGKPHGSTPPHFALCPSLAALLTY